MKGYTKLKKYSKVFKTFKTCAFAVGFMISNAWAAEAPSIGELHPPVVAAVGQQKIVVYFLKNNLKNKIKDVHVADAEIFYSSINSDKATLNYVWKIEGEQITSVFFYEWKSPDRSGKTMYVLTKSKLSNSEFDGVTYSTLELPLIKDGDRLSVSFFPGDSSDSILQNCREGRELATGKNAVCAYKDAGSIKKYLTAQDK